MADELTQEQQDALALITGAKDAARNGLSEKMAALVGDIDALKPLYPDGFTTDLQQIRNYLTVMGGRLTTEPPVIAAAED